MVVGDCLMKMTNCMSARSTRNANHERFCQDE